MQKLVMDIYYRLLEHFGPQNWWPAKTEFEVIIGAILTQNTAWANVAKALKNLSAKRLLNPAKLRGVEKAELVRLIRPAGYYNIKAARLKEFLEFLFQRYQGDLRRMFSTRTRTLRDELLAVKGIGEETADSILLYAARRPVFVVDAYTRRILVRHKLISNKSTYHQIQSILTENLPRSVRLYNEYHALIVKLGKTFCTTKPRCKVCPISGCFKSIIRHGGPAKVVHKARAGQVWYQP